MTKQTFVAFHLLEENDDVELLQEVADNVDVIDGIEHFPEMEHLFGDERHLVYRILEGSNQKKVAQDIFIAVRGKSNVPVNALLYTIADPQLFVTLGEAMRNSESIVRYVTVRGFEFEVHISREEHAFIFEIYDRYQSSPATSSRVLSLGEYLDKGPDEIPCVKTFAFFPDGILSEDIDDIGATDLAGNDSPALDVSNEEWIQAVIAGLDLHGNN